MPTMRRSMVAMVAFATLLAVAAPVAAAFEARLLRPDGAAAAGYSVSVIGQPVTIVTDESGRLTIDPPPPVPFVLVATSPAGETSAPFEVSDLAVGEIELPEVLRESVTVVSGVAPSLDLLPGSVATVLTREELEQRAPQRLYQALESIAGASKLGDGADAVPALRNLGRGRTLILIDGARVTAERRAGPSATFVDPASLGSVEVVRGPGSVIYGSDAFGGVLNAVTRDPEMDRFHLSYGAEGSFESSDEQSGFVAASTPVGSGALLVEGHYRDAGDFAAGGGEEIYNSSYTSFGGALRYVVPTATGRLRVGLALDRVDDLGKAAIDSRQIRAYYPNEDSDRLTASWLGAAGSWDAVEAAAFYGTYDTVLDRDRAPTATSNRRIDRADTRAKDASARLVAGRSLAGGRFQAGLDLATRFDLESVFSQIRYAEDATTVSRVDLFPAIDDAQKVDSGLFATWTRPLADRISLGLGARGDYVESENRGGYFGDHVDRRDRLLGQRRALFRSVRGLDHDGAGGARISHAHAFGPLLSRSVGARFRDRQSRSGGGRRACSSISERAGGKAGRPSVSSPIATRSTISSSAMRWATTSSSATAARARSRASKPSCRRPSPRIWSLEAGLAVSDGGTDGDAEIDDIAPPNGWLTLRCSFGRAFAFGRVATFLEQDEPGPTELARPGYTLFDLGGGLPLQRCDRAPAAGEKRR